MEKTLEEMGPEQSKCLPLKGTNNHSWFSQQYEGVQVAKEDSSQYDITQLTSRRSDQRGVSVLDENAKAYES